MNSENYFNDVATKWDEMRKSFFPDDLKEKIIEKTLITENETVVDLGCGSGFLTQELAKHNTNIIAIDQSEKMIEIINEKFRDTKNVTAKIGNGIAIPLADESVEKVTANMYIHHIEKPVEAFKEVFRILKKGGKFVFADLDEHQHEFLRTEQNDAWLGFKRTVIEKWLKNTGFNEIEITCANSNCCSTSVTTNKKAEISIFIASATKC